jgi:hypothetical protein
MELIEQVALAMINRDRTSGGWPEIASRDAIANSDGYDECAEIAIAATFAYVRGQAAALGGDDNGVFFNAYDRKTFAAMLNQIERTDNDRK